MIVLIYDAKYQRARYVNARVIYSRNFALMKPQKYRSDILKHPICSFCVSSVLCR